MYLSVFDYYWCYDDCVASMHDIFVLKVLADVGYANDRMVCIHKKRVCDVALACRRVGSKRVKALSYFKTYVMIR